MKKILLLVFLTTYPCFSQTVVLSGLYNTTATAVTLLSGQGSYLPTAPPSFYASWYDSTYVPPTLDPNYEIVTVSVRSGDVLSSISRGQGGTTPKNHNTLGHVYWMSLYSSITPTFTTTSTCTQTMTNVFTNTSTLTYVNTPTITPTPTTTNTPTITNTPTVTNTPTDYHVWTLQDRWNMTRTAAPTGTVTPTFTSTSTSTFTTTNTTTSTSTATLSPTFTSTFTTPPTSTATPTVTMTPTVTNTFTPLQVSNINTYAVTIVSTYVAGGSYTGSVTFPYIAKQIGFVCSVSSGVTFPATATPYFVFCKTVQGISNLIGFNGGNIIVKPCSNPPANAAIVNDVSQSNCWTIGSSLINTNVLFYRTEGSFLLSASTPVTLMFVESY